MSAAQAKRDALSIKWLNADMQKAHDVLGEQCPLHAVYKLRENDLCSLTVTVEGTNAHFRYVWQKVGSGNRTFEMPTPFEKYLFERFCVVMFGKPVVDAARRHFSEGIKVDSDYDK